MIEQAPIASANTAATPVPELGPLRRTLDPELLAALREACRQARPERVAQLAERVAEQPPEAANLLRALADDFRYQAMLHSCDVFLIDSRSCA